MKQFERLYGKGGTIHPRADSIHLLHDTDVLYLDALRRRHAVRLYGRTARGTCAEP
jgi:hypothetical protein